MLMSTKEALSAREDMSNYDSWAKGVYDVLVVGVEEESVVYVAWVSSKIPEKPITAFIWRSYCIKSYIFEL